MPDVLGNPIALFCIVCLPPSMGKGSARLHWGKTTMQSWELRAECLSCAVSRSLLHRTFGALLLRSANVHWRSTMEVMWGKTTGCLRDIQGQQPGPPPVAATRPRVLLLLQLSLWCHAVLCLIFFTFLRVSLASRKRVEVTTNIEWRN